jgi:hypothetical protein
MLLLHTITLALAGLALALYFIIAHTAIICMFITAYSSRNVVIIRTK